MNGYNACFLWGSSHIPWRRETRSIISINSIMVSPLKCISSHCVIIQGPHERPI